MTEQKQKKRLTVTELLKNKEQYSLKKDQTETLEIARLGVEIVLRKPDKSLCLETMEMTRDENTSDTADAHLVYNTVIEPDLKDSQLQESFGVRDPLEIVDKIFEPGEVAQISEIAMELAGFKKGTVSVKTAKN